MVRCAACQHFDSYQDGEMEPQFGEMVCTGLWWVEECKLGCNAFSKSEPVECKKFKPHKSEIG